MSILIKGMEVPRNCIECRFENFNNCDVLDKRVESVDVPPWCPLIEVPPHGRLIDADDIENITVIMNENGSGFNRIDAPTIIEAEDGE